MKRKNILIPLIVGALAIPGIVASFNKSNVVEVDATSSSPISGSFIKVNTTAELGIGTKVIFVSDDGQAMDDIWGNPGYLHGSGDGVTLSSNLNEVTLNNSNATIFTVEAGTEANTFAFRADRMKVTGQKKSNIYIAHNEKDYYGDNTFKNIGYFKDRDIAVEVSNCLESSWYVEFNVEQKKYTGENFVHTYIRNAKNVKAGYPNNELTFTYDYAPRFCSNMGNLVNIYKIKDDSLYSIVVTKEPDKTTYNYGEAIDLTGLEIDVYSQSGTEHVTYDYSLDNNFSYPSVATGEGEVFLEVYYTNKKFTVPIIVNKPTYSATKIGELADYRGSYFLAEESAPYAFDGSNRGKVILAYDQEGSGVYYAHNLGEYERIKFTLTKDESGYHLLNYENKYLNLDALFSLQDNPCSIIVEHTDYGELIKGPEKGNCLCVDMLNYCFAMADKEDIETTDFLHPVVLCKCELTSEEQTAIDTFTSSFISTTNVCDETGSTFSITSKNWGDLEETFAPLSDTVQAEFVNTLYNVDEEDTSAIQFAMSRYDYIYSKYHEDPRYSYITDFIGRLEAGTMQRSDSSTFFRIDTQAMNSTFIVIAVVSTALVAASLLLVYRKKKNQK